jgi:hypothetical protein
LLFGLILFGLNCIALTMALSTLFSDSKISTYTGVMLMFIPTNLLYFMFIQIFSGSVDALMDTHPYFGEKWFEFFYFIPHFSFSRIFLEYLVNHGRPYIMFKLIMPLEIHKAWIAQVLSLISYLLLYVYLDAVLPTVYGVTSSKWFCFSWMKRKIIEANNKTERVKVK